ncbi:DUF3488 and DUF4129 domain-containing transglutaminase family protein [Gloeocapsa sp. PCC 73106]|uniref:transglutaminase TgpA family protein n=1 Tax=Gloeocapsa sp. PCC 73106 TaxID=102232 RepID=UPI0002ACCFA1|nr:DUF3488 and DUF4129 domain-containing transglutaminase family protein [Gloeocapsa sp. PCC 73106]ELR99807.1 transglutaminase-like enzyme, predicted cysteine protease [Gloeocapsa sp. PCC 73106]
MTSSTIKRIPGLKQLWKRLDSLPLPQTEESILLRFLVQTLVIVGIIATDIASGRYMSLWAIPLSIVGAAWSWRRRRYRNVMVKFLLAVGMILVLFLFFGNLFANLTDTRMVLAELLIQLQVLHSFDLPRRKDLGYSMVIGLILLGVAGTVSQTLSFAPLLLVFLAIALPTLNLDYQARLGIKPENKPIKPQNRVKMELRTLKVSKFAYLTLGIILLGLVIFAVMPRFSGYQFRSFPMDSPVDLQERRFELENSAVINPGLEGLTGENNSLGKGRGLIPESGPGELDTEFYYGFNHKMNQNLRGTMTPKLVMRIRSQAPGFWRMLAFDYYNGQGWEISREAKTSTISRPHWSYRFSLPVSVRSDNSKTIVQTYNIASDLPNIIPVLSQPQYLFFPTREIAVDAEDGLRSPFYLIKGLTYTVVSQVPYRDRTLLRESSQDYPLEITKYYLQVPNEIQAKVKEVALSLLAKSPQPITSPYEQALFLAQSLKQNYTIQPDLPFFEEDEDLVESFLFRHQGGYPDHFASVLTVMLRSLGIPARLGVGFASGNFNPFTGYYLIYNTDAHALTEVYFPRAGWFAFDPIPGNEIVPQSFQEDQGFGILGQIWRWISGWLPNPVSEFINNLFEAIFTSIYQFLTGFWRLVSNSIVGFLIGILSVVLLSFLIWLGFAQAQNWRQSRYLAKLAPIERLYREMLNWLLHKGYPKHPAQTPLEYAQIAREHHQASKAKIIEEISQAYVEWRYGAATPNVSHLYQRFKLLKTNKK